MNIKKKTTIYDVGNPGPGLGQALKCGRDKCVNRISTYLWVTSKQKGSGMHNICDITHLFFRTFQKKTCLNYFGVVLFTNFQLWVSMRVSVRVNDWCLTPSEQFFSYTMVRTSYILMRWCCLLSWIFIVLQQSAGWHIAPHRHINLILSNYCLLFLLNDTCFSRETANTDSNSLVWPDWGLNPWSNALDVSTLTITPPMQSLQGIQ